jgi:hypothetical protein
VEEVAHLGRRRGMVDDCAVDGQASVRDQNLHVRG